MNIFLHQIALKDDLELFKLLEIDNKNSMRYFSNSKLIFEYLVQKIFLSDSQYLELIENNIFSARNQFLTLNYVKNKNNFLDMILRKNNIYFFDKYKIITKLIKEGAEYKNCDSCIELAVYSIISKNVEVAEYCSNKIYSKYDLKRILDICKDNNSFEIFMKNEKFARLAFSKIE